MNNLENLITLEVTISRFQKDLKNNLEREILNKYVKFSDFLGLEIYFFVKEIVVDSDNVQIIGPQVRISSISSSLDHNGLKSFRFPELLDTKIEIIERTLFLKKAKEVIDSFKNNI